ncbi:unnamed protein product [Musa hybrid cultivar]
MACVLRLGMEKPSSSKGVAPKYKGVRRRKWGKWVAEARYPNSRERLWLGSFATPEMAARAYDAAVYCLRGPGEALNFPDQPPNIPSADKLSKYEIRAAAVRHAHEGAKRPQEGEARQGGGEEAVDPGESSSGLGMSGEPVEESLPDLFDSGMVGGMWPLEDNDFWIGGDGGGGHDDDDDDDDDGGNECVPLWNF